MRAERAKLSRHCEVAKTMDYVLKRWAAFTRFLDDRRILPHQQCRGARAARHRARSQVVAARRLRPRRRARRSDVHADPDPARTTSIAKLGSPMCWPASMITRSPILPRCCHGVGPRTWSVVSWQHECRHHCPAQDHLRRTSDHTLRLILSSFVEPHFLHASVRSLNSPPNRIGVIRMMTISVPQSGHADETPASGGVS
jgi:hypothetical protein